MSNSAPLMSARVKIHDGVIGGALLALTGAAILLDPRFVYVVGLTGAVMLSSAFTGFCPVHFLVRKAHPSADP